MKTIQELATEARAINALNGWGLDFHVDHIPNYLALLHSEVTEAYEAETRHDLLHELADVLIRGIDLCELLKPNKLGDGISFEDVSSVELPTGEGNTGILMGLHSIVSHALERYRKAEAAQMVDEVHSELVNMLDWTVSCIRANGYENVTGLVQAKLNKNRGRGYRHGGRRT